MLKVHVLLRKEEIDVAKLPGKVAVVLDILFATSSIVTVLANGASGVVPALDGTAARTAAAGAAPGTFILSGEMRAVTLPGFAHPMPLALLREGVEGRTIFYATTNGTVALRHAAAAAHVYAGALLNARATVEHVLREHGGGSNSEPAGGSTGDSASGSIVGSTAGSADESSILIVCAGSLGSFNLEDFYGAGHFVSLFRELGGRAVQLTDAARAALLLHDRLDALECLRASRVGRMMLERGLLEEVEFAAAKSRLDVVAKLVGERVVAVPARP